MLNLNAITLCTMQIKALVPFYEALLGKPADMIDREQGFYGWQMGKVYFSILQHSEMGGKTKDPGRIMLNLETTKVKEEFARVKALGASVVKEPYQIGQGWIATLADPDGNYFQLVTPM